MKRRAMLRAGPAALGLGPRHIPLRLMVGPELSVNNIFDNPAIGPLVYWDVSGQYGPAQSDVWRYDEHNA